jgi:hypothetical protein
MNVSRSLLASLIGTLIVTPALYGQTPPAAVPDINPQLTRLEELAKEANELKKTSRWQEFRAKYADAEAIHQQASNELANQQKKLDQAREQLDAALHQAEPPQIMIQGFIAEAIDLDDNVLRAACRRVAAESLPFDPDTKTSHPVHLFKVDANQAHRLLEAIKSRRHLTVRSRPSILALDNQIAEISMGQLVERPKKVRIKADGDVEIDRSSDTVGLTVSTIPTVEANGATRLQLIVNNSSLSGSTVVLASGTKSGDVVSPLIDQVRAQTDLLVPAGMTLLVAIKSPPPNDDSQPAKTSLILLTPHVITPDADADAR